MNAPYDREWRRADSLLQSGFPESAAKIVTGIYGKAQQNREEVQLLKAELFLLSADFQRSEEAYKEAITKAEGYVNTNSFPIKNIWQSITAQLYWNYYQQHRWELLQRTSVSGETMIDDFEQWDARRFFSKISALYEASVSKASDLAKIDISKYDPVLVKGVNTKHLRPTLLDLLAFRALSYFENDEKDLTRPAFAFSIKDKQAFAPLEDFIRYDFRTADSASLQLKALKLYQQLLSLHQQDSRKDALIDADLRRLQFVYQYSVLPGKEELYRKALENIESSYSSNPVSGMAAVRLAELMMQRPGAPRPGKGRPIYQRQQIDYRPAKEPLEKVAAKFPKEEAGLTAERLLQDIERKTLNVTVEEVVLPEEPSKFLLAYRNVKQVKVKVVAIQDKERFWRRGYYGYDNDDTRTALYSLPAVKEWSVALPGTEDFAEHSTEIKIDALEAGMYAVIVSRNEQFSTADNILASAVFQVSELSLVTNQNNATGYALHRKTGKPLSNVQIVFYKEQYNGNKREYEHIAKGTAASATDGSFSLRTKDVSFVKLKRSKDEVFISGGFYGYNYETEDRSTRQTFFFTDRSIYRPGQTVYFKGILLEKSGKGKKNQVVANQKTTVTLYDVNGQKVDSRGFTTNEFGSFTGTFTAPEGLLTGNMRIENENGSAYFSVEEYKRPKFYVQFDTLKKDFALGDNVAVSGKALAYAGNNVDGARVSYRVVRTYYFPYPWLCYHYRYLPQTQEMEIANGTAETDAQGNFRIDFSALPDESVDPKTLPVFTYTVTTNVTDINGETRSGTESVNIGYTSLHIVAAIPEALHSDKIEDLNIVTRNLNGDFVAADIKVKISRLKEPSTVLRKRLWELPDHYTMDSVAFKNAFPNDVYRDEDNPQNWKAQKTVLEKTVRTAKDGKVSLDNRTLAEPGWYVIEVTTNDKNGKLITEKKFTQVVSDNGVTNKALALINRTPTAAPGEVADVRLISGYDDLHVLRMVLDMEGAEKTEQLAYNRTALEWTRRVTEDDRGGLLVSYITVRENRVYTEQAVVNVPWSNKELNISWETHRDKLLPGAQETWTMVISGSKKEKVAAEMVATLYDASLDAFKEHRWNWYGLFPSLSHSVYWNAASGFGQQTGMVNNNLKEDAIDYYEKRFDEIRYIPAYGYGNGVEYKRRSFASDMVLAEAAPAAANKAGGIREEAMAQADASIQTKLPPSSPANPQATPGENKNPVRKNLQETAFFIPQVQTDAAGNIRLSFTMPEALTEWKMMAFAHTKDMSTGYLEGKIKTQKDLMVMPNLPRFLRQGDHVLLTTKIANLGDKAINGVARIELRNALNGQSLDLPFRLAQKEKPFTAAPDQSMTAEWELHVPESLYIPVVITISAKAGDFADGEETTVPVLTNRMLVTETLPLWINGEGVKNFTFDKLLHSDTSNTLVHHALTLEYTGNPAWYAVQALPYMMEYPYECAEQTFNRFYATALASHILVKAPKVKAVFDQWRSEAALSSFSSPLAKNEELKSALLQETPWVLEAQSETEQRKRIAQLFDAYRLSKELDATLKKLMDKQRPDGAFSWFDGMQPDRYITQYIVTGLARLQKLGVQDRNGAMKQVIERALPYLDKELKNDYDQLVRSKTKLEEQHIGYTQVQYLYMRSFLQNELRSEDKKAYDYYLGQAGKFWSGFNAFTKGMIALALNRSGNTATSKTIIQSLRETAISKEEMGMYWVQRGYGYWWYEAPIETQSLLIECFAEVDKDAATVDRMKLWLLKNKQTNNWETTKATADACYALLLTGSNWLESTPQVTVSLGDKIVRSDAQKQAAGSGYFKLRYEGSEVTSGMGKIELSVTQPENNAPTSKAPSWGAVYWQYFENLDKISSAKTPLEIKKQLFIERNTPRGPELIPVTEKNVLKVGDKVKARIEVLVDRDMEYVHLKDMRASCFEPVNVISGYKYQQGLGYYESTRDVSTNFFFDRLPRGKYVFEYPMFVQQKGNFSNGIATVQCMYAPEFSGHSAGVNVQVK